MNDHYTLFLSATLLCPVMDDSIIKTITEYDSCLSLAEKMSADYFFCSELAIECKKIKEKESYFQCDIDAPFLAILKNLNDSIVTPQHILFNWGGSRREKKYSISAMVYIMPPYDIGSVLEIITYALGMHGHYKSIGKKEFKKAEFVFFDVDQSHDDDLEIDNCDVIATSHFDVIGEQYYIKVSDETLLEYIDIEFGNSNPVNWDYPLQELNGSGGGIIALIGAVASLASVGSFMLDFSEWKKNNEERKFIDSVIPAIHKRLRIERGSRIEPPLPFEYQYVDGEKVYVFKVYRGKTFDQIVRYHIKTSKMVLENI